MKTKIFITFIVINSLIFKIDAQTADSPYICKLTKEMKIYGGATNYANLSLLKNYGKDGYLAIYESHVTPFFTFCHFSSNFELLNTYTPPIESKQFSFINFKNKTYCIFQNDSKSSQGGKELNALDFSRIKFNFDGVSQKILDVPNTNWITSTNIKSKDSSKVLVTYDIQKDDGKATMMAVIDENLNVLYQKECPISDNRGDFIPFYNVLNDGKIYVIYPCFYDDNKDLFIKDKPNFYYKILIFEKDKEIPTEYKINLQDCYVDYNRRPEITQNKNNSISVAFMCNKQMEFKLSYGKEMGKGPSYLCYINLNSGTEYNVKDNLVDIPREIISKYTSSNKELCENLSLEKMIAMNDGSVKLLMAEIVSGVGSFYVMSLNSNNKYEWTTKIPRNIPFNTYDGLVEIHHSNSFNFLQKDGVLDVFYFGNKLNFNLQSNQYPMASKKVKDLFLLVSRIDKDGKLKTSLIDGEANNYEINNETYLLEPFYYKRGDNFLYNDVTPKIGPFRQSKALFLVLPK